MRMLLSLTLLFIVTCTSNSQNVVNDISLQTKARSYPELKKSMAEKQEAFALLYNENKDNNENRDSILMEARTFLLLSSNDFFKAWYNTPWTFHGHSQTPRQGSIACGYFVTTTLRDMGFDIPRIKWAQQASEYIVKKLSSDISRFHNKSMKDIVSHIETKGEGLYLVGLDSHVGYIYYLNGNMSFVHANYYRKEIGVMSEKLIGRNPLNDSRYRVIGKIFDDDMVCNWILNIKYPE